MSIKFWHPNLLSCYMPVLYLRRYITDRRAQGQRGLSPGATAVRLLGLGVRIPPREWMSVYCECGVLSGRGHCVGLITRPVESNRMWHVLL
jgi:hypothetical protein